MADDAAGAVRRTPRPARDELRSERDEIAGELEDVQQHARNVAAQRDVEHRAHLAAAAERDALQARLDDRQTRIDKAMAEIAAWWGTARPGDRVLMAVKSILSDLSLAALQGDQPAEPPKLLIPPDDPCQDFRCRRIDGRCVGMHCARCGEPCGAQGHTACFPVAEPTGEVDRG